MIVSSLGYESKFGFGFEDKSLEALIYVFKLGKALSLKIDQEHIETLSPTIVSIMKEGENRNERDAVLSFLH